MLFGLLVVSSLQVAPICFIASCKLAIFGTLVLQELEVLQKSNAVLQETLQAASEEVLRKEKGVC